MGFYKHPRSVLGGFIFWLRMCAILSFISFFFVTILSVFKFFYFFFLMHYLFIYLAPLHLNCSIWDILVVACRI